jgi:hypothetical protein
MHNPTVSSLPSSASLLWLLESLLGESCKVRFQKILTSAQSDKPSEELAFDCCAAITSLLQLIRRNYPNINGALGMRLAIAKLLGLVFYYSEAEMSLLEGRKLAVSYLNSNNAIEVLGEEEARRLLGYLAVGDDNEFALQLKRLYDSMGATLIERMAFYSESLLSPSGSATPRVIPSDFVASLSKPVTPIKQTTNSPQTYQSQQQKQRYSPSKQSSPIVKPSISEVYPSINVEQSQSVPQPYSSPVRAERPRYLLTHIPGDAIRASLVRDDDILADIIHQNDPRVREFMRELLVSPSRSLSPHRRLSPGKKRQSSSLTPQKGRRPSSSPARGRSHSPRKLLDRHSSATRIGWDTQPKDEKACASPDDKENSSIRNIPANYRVNNCHRRFKKTARRFFTEKEVGYLLSGYRKFPRQWAVILNSFPFDVDRTSVDLKDKFRNLEKNKLIPEELLKL